VQVPNIPEYSTPDDQERSAEALRASGVRRLELFDCVIRGEAPQKQNYLLQRFPTA